MFNSKKAKYFASMVAATCVAAIPVFSFNPKVASGFAAVAALSMALVNFFKANPSPDAEESPVTEDSRE
jgi:hypothetical protein